MTVSIPEEPSEFKGQEGSFEFEDGPEPVSSFSVTDQEDGIRIKATLRGARTKAWFASREAPRSFLGTTEDGLRIEIAGLFVVEKIDLNDPTRVLTTYFCVESDGLRVSRADQPEAPKEMDVTARFALLNVVFDGNVYTDYPDGFARDTIELNVDGHILRLTQVRNHGELRRTIARTGGSATTAMLKTSVARSELPALRAVVGRVCDLLTFATANLVTWRQYRAATAQGTVVGGESRPVPTRGYSGGAMIDRQNAAELIHFVESTYVAFTRLEGPFQLHRVASAYIDGINSAFLETQALALGVLGEYLIGRWLEQHDPNYRVVPEHIAKPLLRALTVVGRQFVISHATLAKTLEGARRAMEERLPHVCNPSLRQKLEHVNDGLGAGIEAVAIGSFAQTRNDLAHRMAFNVKRGSERDQYRNMRYVVDRLLLSLLEYQGPFIDFRTREKVQFTTTRSEVREADE